MRYLRLAGVLVALTVVPACAGGGDTSDAEPSSSPGTSPVQVRMGTVRDHRATRLGISLDFTNEGRPRPDVTVDVRLGGRYSGDARPKLEQDSGAGFKPVALATDKRGFTGTFRMDLPRGTSLSFLRITPSIRPKLEGQGVPVDVAFRDGTRTLARKHLTAPLTALSLERVSPTAPAPLRDDRWTEVVYTAVNHSGSAFPKAQIQAEYTACPAAADDPQDPEKCPDFSPHVTTSLRTQYYDGKRWRDVTAPDDGSAIAETLTMPLGALPAESTRKFTFRFSGREGLDRKVRLLVLSARVNGKAEGASERSGGFASPIAFDVR
ncbi:hypothetical protein [Streptomyces flavofungini]|uniref:hypothetical protein n=1 Tax=Streptomyces flavofungini TaxID=68200 RepID=UPI0034DF8DC5